MVTPKSSIDLTLLREEILSDGADDYYGLYEIIWGLNSTYPDLSRVEKVAAAREVTVGLLKDRKIALYRSVWASNRYDPVGVEEALSAVNDVAAYADPTEAPYLCYAAS